MRRFHVVLILSVLVIVSTVQAQNADRPLVLFVEGRDIATSSITNIGAAGASNLHQMLIDLGVNVQRITLNEAIPEEADLVVLLGPLRRLYPAQVARLWVYLHQGGNLLLAVDPDNQNLETVNVRNQIRSSGLTALLDRAYGILIGDTFVADRWFTSSSIANFNSTYMPVYPDAVAHDILAPLVDYDLPVWTWGARHLRVEPFGINGSAIPLLYTETAYAESNQDVFPDVRSDEEIVPTALEMNPGEDINGRLNVAALGENRFTGSRVLVLGDSEMLQNGYGLLMDGSIPRFPGNYVFAQRIFTWLLNTDWLPLPQGLNWIKIDGERSDWQTTSARASDRDTSPVSASVDIQQIHTFVDDRFLYLFIESAEPPSRDVTAQLQFDVNNNGEIDRTISVSADSVQVSGTNGDLLDAGAPSVAYGQGIELRIPYRIVPPQQSLDGVCLSLSEEEVDCLTQIIDIPLVTSRAVNDPDLEDYLVVTVDSINRVNLRGSPGTSQPPTTTLAKGTLLAALGRTEAGDWIYVENARESGWIAASLLLPNGDLMLLPIMETS